MRRATGPQTAEPTSSTQTMPLSGTEALSILLCRTAQIDLHRKPGPQLAELILTTLDLDAVAVFDADLNEIYTAGIWSPNLANEIRNVYFFETVRNESETGLMQRVLRIGNLPVGSLMLRGETEAWTADGVAAVAAITFDRYHSLANETRVESARRTEQMRTTVLDSLAHAYKTPLTAIHAAATGMTEIGGLSEAHSALLDLIQEQTERLNQLTTQMLKTANLEAQDLTMHAERILLTELIDEVIAEQRIEAEDAAIKVSLSRDDLMLTGDREMLAAMLTQLVDNALKYATVGTTVTIRAKEQTTSLLLSVHNLGPAIPAAEHESIFERYFRSPHPDNQAPGTGIGLSIVKRAAQAHGGDVWVTSERGRGTTFFVSLPLTHAAQAMSGGSVGA